MTRMIICALVAILAGTSVSTRALADDTNSDRQVKTQKQMMKECIAKERSANTGASEDDMKKTCREKIQSYNNHPSETTQPPNNP
jgi:pentapeptide MXKDX repeat protein